MKHNYRIDTEFEMVGIWTLPGYSLSSGISGKLIFKDNKLRLELYGDFNDIKENDGVQYLGIENEKEDYIFGFSQDGCTVIIEEAFRVKYKANFPGIPSAEYSSNRCLLMQINYVNYDYTFEELLNTFISEGIDNIECSYCRFSLRDMNLWMNSPIIKRKIKDKSECIYYDLSEDEIEKFIVQGKNLVYSNDVICKRNSNTLSEEHFWRLESNNDKKLTLRELKINIDLFKNLIQFFVDSPTEYTFIDFEIAIEGKFRKTISAQYIYLQYKSQTKTKVSIYYTDIKDRFTSILENWYDKNDRLTLIIDNYLNEININYFSEAKLLNAMKNLEIYHRNFKDTTKDQPVNESLEQYKEQLIEYIEKSVEEKEFQDRFIRNVEYSPEMTLSKRLSELFKKMDSKVKNEFLKLPNKNLSDSISSIVYSLVQTRNYYTHGDDISKYPKSIKDTVEQLNITSVLNQIIKYYIYEELEMVNDDVIEGVIKGKKNYI